MIQIGKVNQLILKRETNSGFYLQHPTSGEEVFLPPAMCDRDIAQGEEVQAFVYLDAKGLLVATTRLPYAQVGEYALLRAVNVQEFGAFFDWGIEKDLLVPGNEQNHKVKEGEFHLVYICLEPGANRVYGTTKLTRHIRSTQFDINPGDRVSIYPAQETDLGYKVIINKKYIGLIYHNEIFSPIELMEEYSAVVKKIRDDGLVDCALQAQGVQNLFDAKAKVLQFLSQVGGKSDLHDKSSPEQIKKQLGMSKQTFKSAIGMLYKDRKILIHKNGIELANKL